MSQSKPSAPVAILLSTFNGERFLEQQLRSFINQNHADWTLHWRDDGSDDRTLQVLAAFHADLGGDRSVAHSGGDRLHSTRSFLTLLSASLQGDAAFFAFSDQDDIWLPNKLARGVAALSSIEPDKPALYCAAHLAVDENLTLVSTSPRVRRETGFPAALTQNIAQGCTMMLNRPAAELIASSQPPPATWHDWWAYLLVTASDGIVLVDRVPTLLYRLHSGNQIGNAGSLWRRGLSAIRRGRKPFMTLLREHVRALEAQPHLLTPKNRIQLRAIADAVDGQVSQRLRVLKSPAFRRQTWQETLFFRLWFTLG